MINIFEYPFIYRELNKYLFDKDKFNLIIINKFINSKRNYFLFEELIWYYSQIKDKWFFNNVVAIQINKLITLPQRLKRLEVDFQNFTKEDILDFGNLIPNSVEYISVHHCKHFIPPYFNFKLSIYEVTENIILDNVIELETARISSNVKCLGRPYKLTISNVGNSLTCQIPDSVEILNLRQVTSIKQNTIPNSVKKLRLNIRGIFNLEDVIPNSVVELELFVEPINEQIKVNIPNSVKCLKISACSNLILPNSLINLEIYNMDELQSFKMFSVTHLTLVGCYNSRSSHYNIPDCVIHLTIYNLNLKFTLYFNNVKFLKITRECFEHFKDRISGDVEITFIN